MNILFFPLLFLQIYASDLDASIAILQKNRDIVLKVDKEFNISKEKVLSIVAPEISRWVSFNDYVETKALELLYINKGYEYCNFSIGYFQMKPKFIENMEDYIEKNNIVSYNLKYLVIDKNLPVKKQRKIRLKRLKSFEWQLIYAYVFYLIAENRFKNIKFKDEKEKLKFFATAYNTGFMKSVEIIRDKMYECSFPYGENSKKPQDNYGELSYCFYKNYSYQLNEPNFFENNNINNNESNKYLPFIFFSILLLFGFGYRMFNKKLIKK